MIPQSEDARILIIDDNEVNRDAFKISLEREGFGVAAFDNGPDALKHLDAETFDLVLLDIHMPVMNGYDVLMAIRRKFPASDLPVIMETARDSGEDIVRALELGASDYVIKPINFPVALARIRAQLLHKHAIDLLRENEARLHQLDRMKNDFISMVTHELTTPIAVIDGAARCFEDKLFGPMNEKYESYVKMMVRNSEQLLRLAQDLLDLTKMSAGRFSIQKQRLDLRPLVADTLQSLASIAENHKVRMRFDPEAPPPATANVDPLRIKQVMSNIIRNALRFAKGEVAIRVESAGTESRFIVEDDGPGIAPDDLPNVFEKFYQGRNRGRSEGGSGLGLAIVRGIVEGHGGRVTAENLDPGRAGHTGVKFVVTLG